VEEETGLQNILLGAKIGKTYHTYRLKDGSRVLKRTFWYRMTAAYQELIPQTEEDIQEATWKNWKKQKSALLPIYNNILDVLHRYYQK